MDQHNYMGVSWKSEHEPILEEKWAINKGLSPKLQDYYKLILLSYISEIYQNTQIKNLEEDSEGIQNHQ